MNDEAASEIWISLTPAPAERRRIDARVFSWLEAHDTSLAAEWLGLVQTAPFAAVGLAALSAVSIVLATPLLWLARALL
jgi:hypothetical protein